jgi:hypothetical protein
VRFEGGKKRGKARFEGGILKAGKSMKKWDLKMGF